MRVLFSTIGSRGDVQHVVALASHLKALRHEVRVYVPPDFREWVESLGIPVTPAQRRHIMEATVATVRDVDFYRARVRCDCRSHRATGGGPIGGGEVGDSLRLRRLCAGGAAVAASCTTALAALTWTGLRPQRTTTVSFGHRMRNGERF